MYVGQERAQRWKRVPGLYGNRGPAIPLRSLCKVDTKTELDILSVWQELTLGKTGGDFSLQCRPQICDWRQKAELGRGAKCGLKGSLQAK